MRVRSLTLRAEAARPGFERLRPHEHPARLLRALARATGAQVTLLGDQGVVAARPTRTRRPPSPTRTACCTPASGEHEIQQGIAQAAIPVRIANRPYALSLRRRLGDIGRTYDVVETAFAGAALAGLRSRWSPACVAQRPDAAAPASPERRDARRRPDPRPRRGRHTTGRARRARPRLRRPAAAARAAGGRAPHVRRHRLARAADTARVATEPARARGRRGRERAAGPRRGAAPTSARRSRRRDASAACRMACSTSPGSTPATSCAASRSSWASSRAPSPRSSAPPRRRSRTPALDRAARPPAGRSATPTAWRGSCACWSTTPPPRAGARTGRGPRRGGRRARRSSACSTAARASPRSERDAIFERFQRGEHSTAPGFGLGLAIGSELARRMAGRLTLEHGEPAPGEPAGARFALALPVAPTP